MSGTEATTIRRNWRDGGTPAWIAAFALLALLVLVLLVAILWRAHEPQIDLAERRALEERLARNAELEREIAALESEAEPACPPGLVRSDTAAHDNAAASPPAAADAPAAKTAEPAEGVFTNRELVALLNEATAMVLTQGGSASGFFIAPDLLVTNRHAVEDSGGNLYVTSKALGRVHPARVLATSPTGGEGGEDFALVQVDGAPARRTLAFSSAVEPLLPIVAAGYPGLTIINDAGFRALLQGDLTAAPELVLNRGEVQAIQRSPEGLEVIAHSGRILQGNSGGPLIDGCGRVVGINTFIAVDASQAGQVSYAIAAHELARFLSANGAEVRLAQSACGG